MKLLFPKYYANPYQDISDEIAKLTDEKP